MARHPDSHKSGAAGFTDVPVVIPVVEILPPSGERINGKLFFPPEERQKVRELAAWGTPYKDISQHIISPDTGRPIDTGTLVKYFRDELNNGSSEANAKLSKSAYLQAIGLPEERDGTGRVVRPAVAPVPMMTKWLTQVRLGYKETTVIETRGEMNTESIGNAVAELSYEDLLKVREIVQRRKSG